MIPCTESNAIPFCSSCKRLMLFSKFARNSFGSALGPTLVCTISLWRGSLGKIQPNFAFRTRHTRARGLYMINAQFQRTRYGRLKVLLAFFLNRRRLKVAPRLLKTHAATRDSTGICNSVRPNRRYCIISFLLMAQPIFLVDTRLLPHNIRFNQSLVNTLIASITMRLLILLLPN